MGEVGVHLEDQLGAAGEGRAEAGDVGGAEAFLARPVQDVDALVLGGEPVGDLAGPVGRAVVDDQDPRRGRQLARAPPRRRRSMFSASL